jgi:hypothetical protein
MPADALYAYAVLPEGAALPPAGTPAILPGAGFDLVRVGGCAALASPVPRAPFQAGPEGRMADPAWLAERAHAHHAVVAACAAAGPALPLAFGALFSSPAPLAAWLSQRAAALRDGLWHVAGCAEWSACVDEDPAAHATWLDLHDPRLRDIATRIDGLTAGRAYLFGRRRQQLRTEARAARIQHLSQELQARLAAHARALPAAMTGLVAADRTEALRADMDRMAQDLAGSGLALRLVGPWPPYASARAVVADD